MENYKGKMIAMKATLVAASLFVACAVKAQRVGYTLKEAESLLKKMEITSRKQVKENVDNFLRDGNASLLWNAGNYRSLRQYSKRISTRLFECYRDNRGCHATQYNRRILALLDLPQYMKDSLLQYRHTEVEVRAAMGDTTAQQELIRTYRDFLTTDIKTEKELYDNVYRKYLDLTLLLYIGTKQSIEVFLEGLNSADTYEDTNTPDGYPRNRRSVFYDLLSSYSTLMDEANPLLSYFYMQKFLYAQNEKDLGKEYQDYLRQLEKYFYERYKVRVNIKAPYLILGQKYYIEH